MLLGSIPRLGRSPGGTHGNPLQHSCLENPHGQRSLAGYSPRGHRESDMTERLSTAQCIHSCSWILLAYSCQSWPQPPVHTAADLDLVLSFGSPIWIFGWVSIDHGPHSCSLNNVNPYLGPSCSQSTLMLITYLNFWYVVSGFLVVMDIR